jgi:hypothetical protein
MLNKAREYALMLKSLASTVQHIITYKGAVSDETADVVDVIYVNM